jgi:CheY-like chemotaxis protein
MNKVLLVVDDNHVSRLLPSFILQPFFEVVQVLACERGAEAVRLLETHQVSHVLLDISMPDMDGLQVAKKISNTFKWCGIRVIAYTADARAEEDLQLMAIGFDDVLLKPLRREDLLRVLDLSC